LILEKPIIPVDIEISIICLVPRVFTFQTLPRTPDLVDSPMDAPLHPCHACKPLKPFGEFKLRAKDDQYGKKGDTTSKYTPYPPETSYHVKIWSASLALKNLHSSE